jgi:hypothetical protein
MVRGTNEEEKQDSNKTVQADETMNRMKEMTPFLKVNF